MSAAGNAPLYESDPHLLPAVTISSGGLVLAGLLEYGGASITPATAESDTELLDEAHTTFNGETHGLGLARRTTSGQANFTFGFGSFPRLTAVYRAG